MNFIMIRESMHEEHIIIVNIYVTRQKRHKIHETKT